MDATKPDYGNWISRKLVVVNAVLALLFVGLAFLVPACLLGTSVFLAATVYFAYARRAFSPRGGDVQGRIRQLVVDLVAWDGRGKALDIGCGNGPLVIELARRFPASLVTGVDLWGGMWEFSQRVCEANAGVEGVAERVTFQQASAASLPFDDGAFDAVVSNLVFHEVRGVGDKALLIKEALRVLKPGGCFVLQDLFHMRRVFGAPDQLLGRIREWGVARVEFVDTSRSPFIPAALRLPFMVGTLGIVHGVK